MPKLIEICQATSVLRFGQDRSGEGLGKRGWGTGTYVVTPAAQLLLRAQHYSAVQGSPLQDRLSTPFHCSGSFVISLALSVQLWNFKYVSKEQETH